MFVLISINRVLFNSHRKLTLSTLNALLLDLVTLCTFMMGIAVFISTMTATQCLVNFASEINIVFRTLYQYQK